MSGPQSNTVQRGDCDIVNVYITTFTTLHLQPRVPVRYLSLTLSLFFNNKESRSRVKFPSSLSCLRRNVGIRILSLRRKSGIAMPSEMKYYLQQYEFNWNTLYCVYCVYWPFLILRNVTLMRNNKIHKYKSFIYLNAWTRWSITVSYCNRHVYFLFLIHYFHLINNPNLTWNTRIKI